MTLERRLLIPLADIRAVVLECKNCGLRVTQTPEEIPVKDEAHCQCGHCWWMPEPGARTRPDSPFYDLLAALKVTRRLQGQPAIGANVYLEVDEPPS